MVTTHAAVQTTVDESDCPHPGIGTSIYSYPGGLAGGECVVLEGKNSAAGDSSGTRTVDGNHSTDTSQKTKFDRLVCHLTATSFLVPVKY